MPVRRIRRKQPYGGSSTHVSEQALRFQYRMRSRLTSCLGQGIAYFWLPRFVLAPELSSELVRTRRTTQARASAVNSRNLRNPPPL